MGRRLADSWRYDIRSVSVGIHCPFEGPARAVSSLHVPHRRELAAQGVDGGAHDLTPWLTPSPSPSEGEGALLTNRPRYLGAV